MEEDLIYICGRSFEDNWSIQGVFSSEEVAVANCAIENDFVGPVPFNKDLGPYTESWPNIYYPLRDKVL